MRRISFLLPLLLTLLCSTPVLAGQLYGPTFFDRMSFGVEWGYSQQFYQFRHYNIISEEGSRINETTSGLAFCPNGMLMGRIGYDVSDKLNVSVLSGYSGMTSGQRMIPLLLRVYVAGHPLRGDGFFTFADGGIAFKPRHGEVSQSAPLIADIGEGYRVSLTPFCSLDLMMSFRALFDTPPVINPEGPGFVHKSNVRSSVSRIYSLSLIVAVNF